MKILSGLIHFSVTALHAAAVGHPLARSRCVASCGRTLTLALCCVVLSALSASTAAAATATGAQRASTASPAAGAAAAAPDTPADALNRPETVITSDELDMRGGEETNHFFFRGNVRIQATNMLATCDEMEVVSARQARPAAANAASASASASAAATGSVDTGAAAAPAPAASGEGTAAAAQSPSTPSAAAVPAAAQADAAANIGSIREIIMTGNVVISQEGRRATAGKATLYPQEGRVVLEDSPKVTDEQGTLSGWRMELNRGEKTVRILSNPAEGGRTRVTLPSMQDLGYRDLVGGDAASSASAPAPASAGASGAGAAASAGAAGTAPQSGSSSAPAAAATSATASGAASGGSAASGAGAAASAADPAAATGDAAGKEEAGTRESGSRGWNPVTSPRRR